ncbi:hypothetical protein BH11MYX2_BH11MYX2_01450 [soil metagenome]
MTYRDDHEAAIERARAVEVDLELQREREASQLERVANLERQLAAASEQLALRAPESASLGPTYEGATWTELLDQLEASERRWRRLVLVMMLVIFSLIGLTALTNIIWLIAALPVVPVVVLSFAKRFTCPVCRGAIGGSSDVQMHSFKTLQQCPHCHVRFRDPTATTT